MLKRSGVIIFLTVLLVHIAVIFAGYELVEKISKLFLMPALAGYFLLATKNFLPGIKKWIVFALFFSWVGDILLLFEANSPNFFLAGLVSFLLAHIFYILFFHSVRLQEKINGKLFLLLPVLIYYAALMVVLSPGLGDMKLPVRIYGVVISFMFMLALHMLYIKNKTTGLLMMIGALLFVISDSVLAVNKFYNPFKGSVIIIILTYGLAQLLLTEGAIQYIKTPSETVSGK